METEVERAARILAGPQNERYVIGLIYDGPEHSLVTFYDRATLHPDWSGPDVVGKVRFMASEIMAARKSGRSGSLVETKVREAELRLFDQLGESRVKQTAYLKRLAVSLSLTLLCFYPAVKIFTM